MVDSVYNFQIPTSLILYTLTAVVLLALAHRFVRPVSRWAALVLFVLPFAVAGDAMLTNRVMAPVDLIWEHPPMNWMKDDHGMVRQSTGLHTDVYLEFIPWREAARWSFANGEWGLRNPFVFAGEPLLAAEQEAVTWPLTWIAALMPAALSFNFSVAITMLIAALAAFLFARELECRESAALVAAIGWAFASSMVMYLMTAMSPTWAWAPLLFLGVRRVVRLRQIAILTFALTAVLASGHPESALFAIMFAVFYGVFELVQHREQVLKSIGMAFAAGALALLLSAIHLLPFLEAMPYTREHVLRETFFAQIPRGAPGEHVVARMATTFFPYLFGRDPKLSVQAPGMHVSGAAGSIILALAVYALIRVRRREPWFFFAMFVLCLLLACEWRPVARILDTLPVFEIALSDRMIKGAALFMCIIAALGVEELCRRGGDRVAGFVALAVLVFIAAGNAFILRTNLFEHGEMFFGKYVVAAEIAGLALLVAVLMMKRPMIAAILALLFAQRAFSVVDMYKIFPRRQSYPRIAMLDAIKGVKEPFRLIGHGRAFPPGTSTMYGYEDMRGYEAMTLNTLTETFPLWCIDQPVYYNRIDDLTAPFLNFLNVRYALTWDREPPPPGWREVSRQRGSMLIENTNVIERAFVPRNVHLSRDRYLQPAMRFAKDFRERAWIYAPDAEPHERLNGPGKVSVRRVRLGYEIDADMEGDGWIVVSESAWPGWRAYVDGRPRRPVIANHSFLAVHVPPGKHHVRLKYWPNSFVTGRAITFVTLIALLVAPWIRRSLRHRR